jgi:hypothetical protein
MSHQDLERLRVAREFSRLGLGPTDDHLNHETIQDFNQAILDYYNTLNLDKRSVATGEDPAIFLRDFIAPSTEQWNDFTFGTALMLTFIEEILVESNPISGNTDNPMQVLTYQLVPHEQRVRQLASADRHFTYVNDWMLSEFEEFYLNSPSFTPEQPISYSAVDIEDILAGDVDEYFDLIKLWGLQVVRSDTRLLDKYMDATKVGGVFCVYDVSGSGALYTDSLKVHKNIVTDINRHIKSREDFLVYHLPVQDGFTVAKRIA